MRRYSDKLGRLSKSASSCLISQLFTTTTSKSINENLEQANNQDNSNTSPIRQNRVAALEGFVKDKDPNGDTNMAEFATLVAYFYKFKAPEDNKRDTIDVEVFLEALKIVGRERDRPQNPAQVLRNAKSQQEYLNGSSSEGFSITDKGEYFVETQLPKTSGKSR